MSKLHVKRGDNVIVITGKDKGVTGKVLSAQPDKRTVVVEGVNIRTMHVKARSAKESGGIQKEPGTIDSSNVMIVCPACKKPTRVAHAISEGKKIRVCKKCGESLEIKEKKKEATKKAKAEKVEDDKAKKADKPAEDKAAAKKPAAKKAAPKAEKPAEDKPAAKKPAAKKAEKSAEDKPVEKKPAAKKAEKPAEEKTEEAKTAEVIENNEEQA